ncbi:hypothetical protein [Pontimicrobium sp. MEBiC06410]
MVKSEFIRIAKQENGKLSYKDNDISIGGGIKSPKVIYHLKISHKGHDIIIINETGTSYAARITTQFLVSKQSLNFKLTTKSHLSTLFSKTKERFKLKSPNPNMLSFIKNNESMQLLNTIANNTLFEPSITGYYNKTHYTLETKYHVQFSDWTQVIEPLIHFYRTFIDEFSKN